MPVRSTRERSLVMVVSIIRPLVSVQSTEEDGEVIEEDDLSVET